MLPVVTVMGAVVDGRVAAAEVTAAAANACCCCSRAAAAISHSIPNDD